MPVIALHLVIEGRVQGVFFRDSTVTEANRLHVTGWVRNVRDGTVEAFVQGASENVEALIQWCRRGPPAADVTGLVVTDTLPDAALKTFEKRADA